MERGRSEVSENPASGKPGYAGWLFLSKSTQTLASDELRCYIRNSLLWATLEWRTPLSLTALTFLSIQYF